MLRFGSFPLWKCPALLHKPALEEAQHNLVLLIRVIVAAGGKGCGRFACVQQ